MELRFLRCSFPSLRCLVCIGVNYFIVFIANTSVQDYLQ